MNIRCNDGYIRSFIPAQSVGGHLKTTTANFTVAYCEHCKYKFNSKPTLEQKDEWRKHDCNTSNLKKWEND